MDYIRPASLEALKSQPLARRENGAMASRIGVSRIAPGGTSPAGFHMHDVDQYYYILTGTLKVEIAKETFEEASGKNIVTDEYVVEPNSLIFFPARVPHRNWNEGPDAVYHISILAPEPEPGTLESIPVSRE